MSRRLNLPEAEFLAKAATFQSDRNGGAKMNLAGSITIARTTNSTLGDEPIVVINIVDKGSRVAFVTGQMSLADFAMAVTGHGMVPINLEVNELDKVGLTMEYKKVEIVAPSDHLVGLMNPDEKSKFEQEARAALAPHETDGWTGRWKDFINDHNRVPGSEPVRFRIHFTRFVQGAGGE